MANLPVFWGLSNSNLLEDSTDSGPPRVDQGDTAPSPETQADDPIAPSMVGSKLLGAVSTLLALTPRGRTDELARLTALAHGYIPLASEEELVQLAKAVANREDVDVGLRDRLAHTNSRAAQTLIKANRLSEEAIAALLEDGDEDMRVLIARHHTLHGKHVALLTAEGSGTILQALLANSQTDFHADAQRKIERQAADLAREDETASSAEAGQARPTADPKVAAQDFDTLDAAGRRAILHRLSDDQPKAVTMAEARRALDPTRHDADLAFLTVIEQRDPKALATLFADTLTLESTMVERLLDEADGDALLVMAKASGLSSTAFARMLILGKIGLSGSPMDTFDLVDRFNALPSATATTIVDAMRTGTQPARQESVVSTQRRALESPGTSMDTPAPSKARSITTLANQGFRRAV